MASREDAVSSKKSSSKKHNENSIQEVEAPRFHQSFFTVSGDNSDDEFVPELIATGKDPQNHDIEVELGSDEERHFTSKRNSISGRVGRKVGFKPVDPLPVINVDLKNNYKNWETAIFAEQGNEVYGEDLLKIAEPVQDDRGILPTDKGRSNTPVTFNSRQAGGLSYSTVFGVDINDIPTSYGIPKLACHELAVVGTFVHKMIIPGLPYRVRLNGSSEYLFEGKALILEEIGQGYGKRLTFESDDLLYNKNFFWSDSNPPNGFAISICLPIHGEFEVKKEDGMFIGNLMVNSVGDDQIIQTMRCCQDCVQIEVNVNMTCKLDYLPNKEMHSSERVLGGIAMVTKNGSKIRVDRIVQVSIAGNENCTLVRIE